MILLKDFISQALLDIVEGVKDAQSKTSEGTVVPNLPNRWVSVAAGFSAFQLVDFEVTVKAEESSGRNIGVGVVSAVFLGVGGSVKTASGKTGGHDATLKFRIPVKLPTSGPVVKSANVAMA